MKKSFKATLISNVSYVDFDGSKKTHLKGETIIVTEMPENTKSIDLNAKKLTQRSASFVAEANGICFDIMPSQFRTDS